jgi:hypothetical protein
MSKRSTGKGRTKREGAALAERRATAFQRWRDGETLKAIAESMAISISSVALDCKLALSEWRETHRAAVSQSVEFELDLLHRLQLDLEQVWEESKVIAKRTKTLPEWRILVDGIGKISEYRRKLLGLDKPTKIDAQTTAEIVVSSTFKPLDQLKAEVRQHQDQLKARRAEMTTEQRKLEGKAK